MYRMIYIMGRVVVFFAAPSFLGLRYSPLGAPRASTGGVAVQGAQQR